MGYFFPLSKTMETIENCGTFSEALAAIARAYFANAATPGVLADAVAQLRGELAGARTLCGPLRAETAAAVVSPGALAEAAVALGATATAARAADAAVCAHAADALLGEALARLPPRAALESEAAALEAAVAAQAQRTAAAAAARAEREHAYAELVRETDALEAAVADAEGENEEEEEEEESTALGTTE